MAPISWMSALKIWNSRHSNGWCVPRKDTAGYNEVRKIMKNEELIITAHKKSFKPMKVRK